jgi:glyoxylate reductase
MKKKPLIVITHEIPDAGIKLLKNYNCTLKISKKGKPLTKVELRKFVKGADAILCMLFDHIDASVVKAAGPQLKVVANYAVGYNNINVTEIKELSVRVGNTPGVLNNSVADFTWALIFAATRRVVEADRYTRNGLYKGWHPMLFLGTELFGKTIGVVGLGRIGYEVAQRACGFGMTVLYYDALGRNTKAEKKLGITYTPLNSIIKKSDIVTLHVPLLPSTKHLINSKSLALMKKTSYLINTSRGPVVDEKALYRALKSNSIKGAALDVFEDEPKLLPGLVKLTNVIVTPHIASATWASRCEMSAMAARNILAVLNGKKMPAEVKK